MTTSTLDGRGVVVIGASAGIGRAFALRAVQSGANVVVAARREEQLKEVVQEAGGGFPVAVDLRHPDDCRRLASEAAAGVGLEHVTLRSPSPVAGT